MKKYDGENFYLKKRCYHKTDAVQFANRLRRKGYNARIEKRYGKTKYAGRRYIYSIYARKK